MDELARERLANQQAQDEARLTPDQMARFYDILAFGQGVVRVRRKHDREIGTLRFDDRPRVYYGFRPLPAAS